MRDAAYWKSWIIGNVAVWSAVAIVLAAKSGVQHDYHGYLDQWRLVLSGADPWSTDNAYGPLHNLLAYLLPFGQLGPKMFIVAALIAANALLVSELVRTKAGASDYLLYLLAVPGNVLIISMGIIYGLNASLVAAFIMLAVALRFRRYDIAAGAVLGLAILLKYYPALLVPLFAWDGRRFRLRLITSAAVITVSGLAAAYGIWGNGLFTPFRFGAQRPPKILSILSALEGWPSLVGGQHVLDFLVRTNAAFVVGIATITVACTWKFRVHWLEASILGYLAMCLTYKIGHQQFLIPWLFLVAALPLTGSSSAQRLGWLCLPFVLFLSIFQWGYAYGSDGYNHILGAVRRDVGFVAFPLGIITIGAYFITRGREMALSDVPLQADAPMLGEAAG